MSRVDAVGPTSLDPTHSSRWYGALTWNACRPYAIALAIFLSSRLVIYLAIAFAIVYVRWGGGPGLWDAGPAWYHHLLRWDSGWYASVVEIGYATGADKGSAQNAAFYPLYPLAARAVRSLGFSTFDSLLIVANIAAVCAAMLLFKLVREQFDETTAYFSVAGLGLFPTSVFLAAGYSEPLALVFILAFFLLLARQRLVAASLCAGLALATRSTGIVLLPVLLWELLRTYRTEPRKLLGYGLVCFLLATSGLTLFMAYLGYTLGDPLRFANAQAAWHGNTGFGQRIYTALSLKMLTYRAGEGFFYFAGGMLLLILFCRRIGVSLALYGIGVLMLPYLTLVGGPSSYGSMPRFALLAFPMFIIIAQLCKERPWLTVILASLSTAGLFGYTAIFSQWHWAG